MAFKVGQKVRVRGDGESSLIVGSIIEVGEAGWRSGKICVQRPNPKKPGMKMTHWVKFENVVQLHCRECGRIATRYAEPGTTLGGYLWCDECYWGAVDRMVAAGAPWPGKRDE